MDYVTCKFSTIAADGRVEIELDWFAEGTDGSDGWENMGSGVPSLGVPGRSAVKFKRSGCTVGGKSYKNIETDSLICT